MKSQLWPAEKTEVNLRAGDHTQRGSRIPLGLGGLEAIQKWGVGGGICTLKHGPGKTGSLCTSPGFICFQDPGYSPLSTMQIPKLSGFVDLWQGGGAEGEGRVMHEWRVSVHAQLHLHKRWAHMPTARAPGAAGTCSSAPLVTRALGTSGGHHPHHTTILTTPPSLLPGQALPPMSSPSSSSFP